MSLTNILLKLQKLIILFNNLFITYSDSRTYTEIKKNDFICANQYGGSTVQYRFSLVRPFIILCRD